ncbi:MAG: hypothetical protein Q8K69_14305 [Bacteroidota bacterium]|nr:hypothetical protein [Bacteroidota bacterium]MDP3434242.1 hypothetical protein [Bacteroidota bacterium]
MDTFVELSIAKEKPVPVSAMREMKVMCTVTTGALSGFRKNWKKMGMGRQFLI